MPKPSPGKSSLSLDQLGKPPISEGLVGCAVLQIPLFSVQSWLKSLWDS